MSSKSIIAVFIGVLFGVYFTYYAIQIELLTPILASTVAGLIGSLTFLKWVKLPELFGIAIYCGSFVGMGNIFKASELLVTTFLASLLLLISSNLFKGFGGKLGLMAYIASVMTQLFILVIGSKKMEGFTLLEILTNFKPTLDLPHLIGVSIFSILGFYLTVYFHHGLKKSAVFSSAFPSFLVGLLYYTSLPYTEVITVTFFSASFVGMAAEDILPKKHFPFVVLTHILSILLFKNNLGSFGGALGTIAFISVFIIIQIDYILNNVIKKRY